MNNICVLIAAFWLNAPQMKLRWYSIEQVCQGVKRKHRPYNNMRQQTNKTVIHLYIYSITYLHHLCTSILSSAVLVRETFASSLYIYFIVLFMYCICSCVKTAGWWTITFEQRKTEGHVAPPRGWRTNLVLLELLHLLLELVLDLLLDQFSLLTQQLQLEQGLLKVIHPLLLHVSPPYLRHTGVSVI